MRNLAIIFLLMATGGQVFAQWLGTNPIYFNAGNVGIGTSNPNSRLHVDGGHVYVGPLSGTLNGTGRISVSGTYAEISLANRAVSSFVESPSQGERWVIYNEGTSTDGKLRFWSGGDRMILNKEGNLGIGTSNPESVLQVDGGGLWRKVGLSTPGITTLGRLGQDLNGVSVCSNAYWNGTWYRDDISKPSFALIEHIGNQRFEFRISNAASGNITWGVPMVITSNEMVGIGTTTPTQKLTVNGTIYGKEVKVDLSVPGPDYVFEEDYKLTSLADIKSYIDQNKHLPEVPSAKEMEMNGIQLGEMNMLLLKKIEELTLHSIEASNRLDKLEKENQELRTIIKSMK